MQQRNMAVGQPGIINMQRCLPHHCAVTTCGLWHLECEQPCHDAASHSSAAVNTQLLSAPGLPTRLYREELVTGLVSLVKFHLQYNLLVLYDVKYRRLYRPSSLNMDDADAEVCRRTTWVLQLNNAAMVLPDQQHA